MIKHLKFITTWGTLGVEQIDGKVAGCSLPFLATAPSQPFALLQGDDPEITEFITALFAGTHKNLPPLAPLKGTAFQQQVWQAIAAIPWGQTQTYGELAATINRPAAVRAVGTACGRNPIPLFIPCHRVIGAHGKIGGFSVGLAWKHRLLAAERGELRKS